MERVTPQGFLPNGQARLRASEWHAAESARIRRGACARFDPLIAEATGFAALRLRLAKAREVRKRIAQLAPDDALYVSGTRREA